MNQISWRHHYIPQFYLNGFTSEKGSFKIYDIEKKSFVKNGKDFFPESYFFEKDSNTIFGSKGKTDFQELKYQKLDSKASEIFYRINNSQSDSNYNINDEDIAYLQYYVGVMYWRNPINYQEIEYLINKKRLKEIGLITKDLNGNILDDIELENKLKSKPAFFKMMKYWFPLISYPEVFECETPLHIFQFPHGLPSLCGDNPIISRSPETFRVYNDDFIFPINSTKILIRGNQIIDMMSSVKIKIDLLVYKQSRKYVCCTDKSYLEKLDWLYDRNYNDLDQLRLSIFKQILNCPPKSVHAQARDL